jgi:hypothetical protein
MAESRTISRSDPGPSSAHRIEENDGIQAQPPRTVVVRGEPNKEVAPVLHPLVFTLDEHAQQASPKYLWCPRTERTRR